MKVSLLEKLFYVLFGVVSLIVGYKFSGTPQQSTVVEIFQWIYAPVMGFGLFRIMILTKNDRY